MKSIIFMLTKSQQNKINILYKKTSWHENFYMCQYLNVQKPSDFRTFRFQISGLQILNLKRFSQNGHISLPTACCSVIQQYRRLLSAQPEASLLLVELEPSSGNCRDPSGRKTQCWQLGQHYSFVGKDCLDLSVALFKNNYSWGQQ